MAGPLEDSISPVVDEAVHKYAGVHIKELALEISDRVARARQWLVAVRSSLSFRDARKFFRASYVGQILQAHGGNVALAAKVLGVSRRTLHRLVQKLQLSPVEFRKVVRRPEYVRGEALRGAIENVIEGYTSTLHPTKIANLYSHAGDLGRLLARELPETPLTLAAAEREFSREYFKQCLAIEGNITKLAEKAGLRFETVHRKLKMLGLLAKTNC